VANPRPAAASGASSYRSTRAGRVKPGTSQDDVLAQEGRYSVAAIPASGNLLEPGIVRASCDEKNPTDDDCEDKGAPTAGRSSGQLDALTSRGLENVESR